MKSVDKRKIWDRDKCICHYCGRSVTYGNDNLRGATIDHKKPKSAGGKNNAKNLVTACQPCNVKKGDLLYHEFLRLVADKVMFL